MSAVPTSFLNQPNVRSPEAGVALAGMPDLPRPVLRTEAQQPRRSRRAVVLSPEEFLAQSLALIASHRLR